MKKTEDLKICAVYTDVFACGNYRVKIPYQHLKRNKLENIDILYFNDLFSFSPTQEELRTKRFLPAAVKINKVIETLSKYDVILLQRVIDPTVVSIMKDLKRLGKILIHEIDDDLFTISPDNPSYATYRPNSPAIKNFKEAMKLADYIHTTNDRLKEVYVKKLSIKPEKIFVFRNAIDFTHPKLKPELNIRPSLPQDKIIIGYNGGNSHNQDLNTIVQPVRHILDKHDNVLFFFCSAPQLFKMGFSSDKARVIPPVYTFDEFPNIPSCFDVGLVPVTDNTFNEGKSYLKIIEYAAWKVPTVCSKVPCYKEFDDIVPSATVLAKNRCEAWVKAIDKLILDEKLRRQIGQTAYDNMTNNSPISIEYINQQRYDFFSQVADRINKNTVFI